MAQFTPQFKPAQYTPGGTYNYIYSISSQIPQYNDFEIAVLESNNHNETYPSQVCNTLVFGDHAAVLSVTLLFSPGNYSDPLLQNPLIYQDSQINLQYPVETMYNGGATIFTSNMKFGQGENDDEPAYIVVERDTENERDVIKWYKNGVLVNTDYNDYMNGLSFALAVSASGNTITGYSYIYYMLGTTSLKTSGLKSNADVLTILNEGGYAGGTENVYGFEDEEFGEFVISKITRADGGDIYSGGIAGGSSGSTVSSCNAELQTICENHGWLGTDLVCYMAGTSDSAEAWDFFNNDPSADGTTFDVPITSDTKRRRIIYTNNGFYWQRLDGEGNVEYSVALDPQGNFKVGGSHIYLTWYRQSETIDNMTRMCVVNIQRVMPGSIPYYAISSVETITLDAEIIDNYALMEDMVEGYDPNAGQADDPQDDPEDIDDPDFDALGSGFLYAFMVDSVDMVNLADALVPDTLADKIRADFGNNLFEFIVSYHLMPCLTNADSLNKTAIAYRGVSFTYGGGTQLMLAPITKSIYTISCGSKVCMPTNTRKNGFENWAQANVQLYLPFIGYVHLNTADVWGKTISISYKFDVLQGTCVANIGVGSNGTLYSFEGVCKYSIPFTSTIDKSNQALLSGIMSTAGAAVSIGGVVAGGSPTGLLNAAGGIANAAGSFLQAAEHKSVINRGGVLSGAPGWNMPRKPALIITVPNWISPGMTYNDINGYPTFKTGTLSGWTGNYVEISQIDLKASANGNGASPNDSELDMINSILKGGVYV